MCALLAAPTGTTQRSTRDAIVNGWLPAPLPRPPVRVQDAQAQTGYRYTYIYSAWRETLEMSAQNVAVRREAAGRAASSG
jgi:hypothetical protein